jgi:predicted flap endonuclease-1-like 5' DNA nuclease
VPVEVVKEVEKVVEVPVEVIREVEKIVEVVREVPVGMVKEIEVVQQPPQGAGNGERAIASEKLLKDEPKDDLKVVEGIGPAIETLLNGAGIYTFEQLAALPANDLWKILEAGGSRFKMHDPTTWPLQAELAASGNWKELSEWQNRLNAGKI